MNIFVLIGHQQPGSFCHAIAATAVEELKAAGHEVVYHDLYAEQFDPILPHEEIPKDAALDPVVEQHCREVAAADGYIVVHPNWWAMPPAILKGWLDRVLRQGVAYQFGPGGVEPLLAGRGRSSSPPRTRRATTNCGSSATRWKTSGRRASSASAASKISTAATSSRSS